MTLMADKDPEEVGSNIVFVCAIYWGFFMDGILNVIYFKITDNVRNRGKIRTVDSSLSNIRQSLMDGFN